jgi:hypothetical protein
VRTWTPSSPTPKEFRGALGFAGGRPSHCRLARDTLGLNKLFWAYESPD